MEVAAAATAEVEEQPGTPEPRGPVSEAVAAVLATPPHGDESAALAGAVMRAARGDGLGEDLQLALYLCYELHYRGFTGVDAGWEWEPGLLGLRRVLEERFLAELRGLVAGGEDVDAAVEALLVEPVEGDGPSYLLQGGGTWEQVREYLVHRAPYQLKEADPYAWVIPRLRGQAKAALVAVEFDEYGGGHGEHVHAKLFADTMAAAGLNPAYDHYLDHAPAESLAVANLPTLLGLHRRHRGALVGHFAVTEITSPPASARIAACLDRLGAGETCTRFFTEHVEADAVHEQVMRRDVLDDLLRHEPALAADLVFGIQASTAVEDRLADRVRTAWTAGRTSLRRPLPENERPEEPSPTLSAG